MTAHAPGEVATNPIHLDTLPDLFGSGGLDVTDPLALLEQLGVADLDQLVAVLAADPGAVQDAPKGAIQDPAGSAIGGGSAGLRGAGGASGAIYRKFPDLEPIPDIAVKAAIFNSSTGPGRRVLHTYSPTLAGSPASSDDRRQAMEDLANAYANALGAFRLQAGALGDDGTLLNFVPVSAVLFAGRFRHPAYDHLHPSYSICAVLLALDWSRGTGFVPPAATIHFYSPAAGDNPLYTAAEEVMHSVAATRR